MPLLQRITGRMSDCLGPSRVGSSKGGNPSLAHRGGAGPTNSTRVKKFAIQGDFGSPFVAWLAEGLKTAFSQRGYQYASCAEDGLQLVFNCFTADRPRIFRRKTQATFVVSIEEPAIKAAYPFLVRSLANHLIFARHQGSASSIHCITPEQGCYSLDCGGGDSRFFEKMFKRLEPLASSRLVINNEFSDDLPEALADGDKVSAKLAACGKKLDELDLLPAPFPLEEHVSERDLRHIKRLYGLGGLSYGNLSARSPSGGFWMSASGVNKASLREVGRDILMVSGYNPETNAMRISVPAGVTPRRASVDAIEHWMIYEEHPAVGAIVHVHAWMDGARATEINFPCGTYELAQAVADIVREEPDPSRAVVGLKNHGLTITGPDLEDIFRRIEGRLLRQIPMR
jgi:ribulose-5-phosphate 4-epimerase/fuculose-1-phosphate aldolase